MKLLRMDKSALMQSSVSVRRSSRRLVQKRVAPVHFVKYDYIVCSQNGLRRAIFALKTHHPRGVVDNGEIQMSSVSKFTKELVALLTLN